MKKSLLFGFVSAVFAFSLQATEYFVDANRPNDDGDGKSEATAKRTLNGALSLSGLADGDIVTVLPGVYDEGVMTCSDDNKTARRSRAIIRKNITFRSRDGRDVTFIMGAADTTSGSAYGMGPDAVTCIGVAKAGAGCTIRGFTFRGGRSNKNLETGGSCGGGFYAYGNVDATVFDSTFDDCIGSRGGAGRYGKYVRCHFRNCQARNEGPDNKTCNGGALREPNGLYFCTFTGCSGGNNLIEWGTTPIMHCTFYGNAVKVSESEAGKFTFVNCVFFDSKRWEKGGSFDACITDAEGFTGTTTDCALGVCGSAMVDPLHGTDLRLAAEERPIAASVTGYQDLPAEYRGHDVDGNEIDETKLVPGAWPNAVECASGRVLVRGSGGSGAYVDGDDIFVGSGASNYFYDTSWPIQHELRFAGFGAEKDIVRVNRVVNGANDTANRAALTLDNRFAFVPPPPGETLEIYPETAEISYVDCHSTAEAEDGTKEAPFKTLAKACDRWHTAMHVLHVMPGLYDQGISTNTIGGHAARLTIQSGGFLRIVGVAGAENTIVAGAADPEHLNESGEHDRTHDGCGTNAVRCFSTAANCVVQGFTFTGGHSGRDPNEVTSNDAVNMKGAAILGAATSSSLPGGAVITDCIISNNVGWRQSIAYGGHFVRCLFADNQNYRYDTLATKAWFANCIFRNNRANGASGNKDSTLVGNSSMAYFCTVDETNVKPWNADATIYDSAIRSTIAGANTVAAMAGTVIDGSTVVPAGGIAGEIHFADAANGDLRLLTMSTATNTGVPVESGSWAWYAGYDFSGSRRTFAAGFPSGALVETVGSVKVGVSCGPDDGVTNLGVHKAMPGDTIEVKATQADTRLFAGFSVNGEIVTTEPTYAYTAPDGGAPVAVTITAVYLKDWYVDATNGSDANRGDSEATAKKTLAAVLEHVVAGDVVHALPGTYEEGTMIQANAVKSGCTPYLRARAVVPDGVTLVSRDGAETTIIRGADATKDPDQYGMGEDAVRGVFLGKDATLTGFTVSGGRADSSVDGSGIPEDDNHHAAGVLCVNVTARVTDCLLTDNIAARAAGSRYGTYLRCRYVSNRCTVNGAASRDGYYYGCCFLDNRGGNTLNFWLRVSGCTFDNNYGNVLLGETSVSNVVVNTFFGAEDPTKTCAAFSQPVTFVNCVVNEGAKVTTNLTIDESCVRATKEQLKLNSGVPIVGTTAGIDCGSLEKWNAIDGLDNGLDAAGNPRVSNGQMDIGCYEADWRPRYSTDLAPRRLTVTEASAEVYEGDGAKSVVIPQGSVTLEWANPSGMTSGTNQFDAQVSGTGTLAILLNGEPFSTLTSADGLKTLTVALSALPVNELVFTYTPGENDAGAAEISNFVGARKGMMLIVR